MDFHPMYRAVIFKFDYHCFGMQRQESESFLFNSVKQAIIIDAVGITEQVQDFLSVQFPQILIVH